ncbi:ankyrin repeat-containing domain protein [Mycena haematopus]|nr:ankyrin repeat-containing domain protein [Mycena haematopus]
MAKFADLPPELILHIVTFLTRETVIDVECRLQEYYKAPERALVPDLPSINALSQTNTVFHCTLNQTLYWLCASIVALGNLALLFAVENELESTLDKLVAAGISLDTEFLFRASRCSLLHIAAAMGLRAMVAKLLGMYGGEMATMVHTREDNNLTPLDFAARGGYMETVQVLAPIPPPSNHVSFETQEQYLSIALLEAARDGNLEICQYLITEGADVNFLHERFYVGTPLFFAARSNPALVQHLLASGADPNLSTSFGITPIFVAADIDVKHALLSAGADIHVKSEYSRNVLAYHTVDVERLRFSLERGVDPNNEDDFGQTPLHYACNKTPSDAYTVVQVLLQFGATTVEKADKDGYTPVHLAMRMGSSEVVEILEPLVQNSDFKLKIATWRKEREERNVS